MSGPAVAASTIADPPGRGRWRALGVLSFALVLSMTTWFSASAVVPQLRAQWGLSATTGSLLTISVQVGFVFGALLSAVTNAADLVGPRRLMAISAGAAAAANLGLLAAHGADLALPLRFLTGACLAGVYPPALKAMSTWFRRGRGTALGVLVGALTLGSATPHLVNAAGGLDWRTVIVATSVLTLAGAILVELFARDGPHQFARASFEPRQALRAFANRELRLVSLGYFGHMWELYAMWAWILVFLGEVVTVTSGREQPRVAALLAFVVIGAGTAGCWVGGVIGDRWGRAEAASVSMLVSGSCALAIGFLARGPLALVLAIALLWGFWVVADSAQFSTLVTEVADQRYVGTAVTLQLALGFTLTVLTIYLIPVVRSAAGWGWAFALLAPGPALGVLAMTRLLRPTPSAR